MSQKTCLNQDCNDGPHETKKQGSHSGYCKHAIKNNPKLACICHPSPQPIEPQEQGSKKCCDNCKGFCTGDMNGKPDCNCHSPQGDTPQEDWEVEITNEFRKALDKGECEPLKIIQLVRSLLTQAYEKGYNEGLNKEDE